MKYYLLEADVAGALGEYTVLDTTKSPPVVESLHFEFEGWDGDDIVGCHLVVLTTKKLAETMSLAGVYGCAFENALISKGHYFKSSKPDEEFPEFLWMKISGKAGIDPVGIDQYSRLVVSEDVLKILRSFDLTSCEITNFEDAVDPKERLRQMMQEAREDVHRRYPRK